MGNDDFFRLLAAGTVGLALVGIAGLFYGAYRLIAWALA
jgi:hypothetical protein